MTSNEIEPQNLWKIATPEDCDTWEGAGTLSGSDLDHKDGFLHFSNSKMVKKVAAHFFSGKEVKLLRIDPSALPECTQWIHGDDCTDEDLKQRVATNEGTFVRALPDGCLHVHLKEPLQMTSVTGNFHVGLGDDGAHVFPEELSRTSRKHKEQKPIKLRKPRWTKVEKVHPDSKGINLMLKCVSCKEVQLEKEGTSKLWEAVVGDETGMVTLQLRNEDHVAICKEAASLRMQNAKSVMIKGFIRIAVDKWAVLKTADEDVSFEPKTGKDISAVEYELAGS